MTVRAYSVSAINSYIKEIMDEDMLLCGLFIEGEVFGLNVHKQSGTVFFSLRDELSTLRCTMFKSDAQNLAFKPAEGMRVVAYGKVSMYSQRGEVRLIVEDMQAVGEGEILKRLDELKRALKAEGIFDNSRPLPAYPRRIAVVTSPTGAAVHDIVNTIHGRNRSINISIAPATVQGQAAPESIVSAIELANKTQNKTSSKTSRADLLIIARGGGSTEDLWAFNDERVARAIHASALPTISAIGHETDYSLSDYAADHRAITPTAAAQMATPRLSDMLDEVLTRLSYMERRTEARLMQANQALDMRLSKLSPDKELERLNGIQSALLHRLNYAYKATDNKLEQAFHSLEAKMGILDKINPASILTRGFAAVVDDKGRLKNYTDLKPGDIVTLKFDAGEIRAEIIADDR